MIENETDLLTLELLDPSNLSVVATWQDTWLLSTLKRSYDIDIEAALPQEALAQNWNAEEVLSLVAAADNLLNEKNAALPGQLVPVAKFEDEMTPADHAAMLASPYQSSTTIGGRTNRMYQVEQPGASNPFIERLLATLAPLIHFCDEADSGTLALRNSRFVTGSGTATEPLIEEPPVVEVAS